MTPQPNILLHPIRACLSNMEDDESDKFSNIAAVSPNGVNKRRRSNPLLAMVLCISSDYVDTLCASRAQAC
jgi:hypothetical protein